MLRLFIALWPGEAVQDALFVHGARFAALGRRIPARNIHATLAFLGAVDPARVDEIVGLIRQARPPDCAFTLDRLGYFKPSRVLWAAAASVPQALRDHQERLAALLGQAGLYGEKRDFRLHVTLLRDVGRPADALLRTDLQVPWETRDVALAQSELTRDGARYRVLQRVNAPGAGAP